jgi:hypothetical protein
VEGITRSSSRAAAIVAIRGASARAVVPPVRVTPETDELCSARRPIVISERRMHPSHVITQGLNRPAAPAEPAAAPAPRARLQIVCRRPCPAVEAALGLQPPAPAVLCLIQHCHDFCSRALVTQLCIEQVPHQASSLYTRVAIAYAHRSHARKQAAAEQTARACGNSLGCA